MNVKQHEDCPLHFHAVKIIYSTLYETTIHSTRSNIHLKTCVKTTDINGQRLLLPGYSSLRDVHEKFTTAHCTCHGQHMLMAFFQTVVYHCKHVCRVASDAVLSLIMDRTILCIYIPLQMIIPTATKRLGTGP